jgi:hypothetical protein
MTRATVESGPRCREADGAGGTIGVGSLSDRFSFHAALTLGAFGAGAATTAWAMPRQDPGVLWPAGATTGLAACALVELAFWILWLAVGADPGSILVVLLGVLAFAMGSRRHSRLPWESMRSSPRP